MSETKPPAAPVSFQDAVRWMAGIVKIDSEQSVRRRSATFYTLIHGACALLAGIVLGTLIVLLRFG